MPMPFIMLITMKMSNYKRKIFTNFAELTQLKNYLSIISVFALPIHGFYAR